MLNLAHISHPGRGPKMSPRLTTLLVMTQRGVIMSNPTFSYLNLQGLNHCINDLLPAGVPNLSLLHLNLLQFPAY